MKYELELEINLNRGRVAEFFDDPENIKMWQPDLVSFEHMSGEAGQIGAKSRILYKIGSRREEMIETIASRNLPEEFSATYEAKGVWNKVDNRFVEIDDQTTRWIFESEFQCEGFLKLLILFLPGMFKRQSVQYMHQFKDYVENA